MCPHAVALDVEQLVNVCRIMRDELNRLPLCPNIILFLFFFSHFMCPYWFKKAHKSSKSCLCFSIAMSVRVGSGVRGRVRS